MVKEAYGRIGVRNKLKYIGSSCLAYLQRSPTANHSDPLDFALGQLVQSIVGNVCRPESIHFGKEDTGNIESYIALPDHHGFFPAGQVWVKIPVLGQAIVPPDKGTGRVDTAGGILSGNP